LRPARWKAGNQYWRPYCNAEWISSQAFILTEFSINSAQASGVKLKRMRLAWLHVEEILSYEGGSVSGVVDLDCGWEKAEG
jgi:hypothetical protein